MFDNIRLRMKEVDDRGVICPRDPLKALMFSLLCPGLGQQYSGHIRRGILLYIILIISSWLSAVVFMLIDTRLSVVLFSVPVLGFMFVAFDAYRCAANTTRDYKLRWFNTGKVYAGVFIFLLLTVNPLMDLVVGNVIVRAYLAYGDSMVPTIIKNDLLVINKWLYKVSSPRKGDVVLINFDRKKWSQATDIIDDELIRRVIAVPGDSIEIKGNDVFVNGSRLDEPYARFDNTLFIGGESDSTGTVKVPEGSYFVLGDNRNQSLDSRVLGPIDRKKIGGKVTKVFWSWNFEDNHIKWERTGMPVK